MNKKYSIMRKTDWSQVPEEEISEKGRQYDPSVHAFFKICYDEENLYVRLRAVEEHIRACHEGDNGMPCEDSCLEFFFCPDPRSQRYFNIEMNPNTAMFLGIGTGPGELIRIHPLNRKYRFDPEAVRLGNGWQVTYRIPFSLIRFFFPDFSPVAGTVIRANVYKCGDLCEKKHFLTWNPIDWSIPKGAFHNPRCFGEMIFE